MVRYVFFSFDYDDIWRVSQVRNSTVTQDVDSIGFIDSAEWESILQTDDESIKEWINEQLKHTSATIVLIGSDTYYSKWVIYEIQKSYEKGNKLMGITIHNLKNQYGLTSTPGLNPFSRIQVNDDSFDLLSNYVPIYNWKNDDGYNNFKTWLENLYDD